MNNARNFEATKAGVKDMYSMISEAVTEKRSSEKK